MARNPVIRRLTLIPSGEDEAVRRYRLAQLDEIALASPPYDPPENRRNGGAPEESPEPEGDAPQ